MGVPSQSDTDREAALKAEQPVDDGWSAPVQMHNDQTTAGPASVGRVVSTGNPDRTVSPRGLNPIGLAEGTDQILAEQRDPVADDEPTELGTAPLDDGLLQADTDTVGGDKARLLAQPERSPLDFVMREFEPAAPRPTSTSNDSSRLVVSLLGDQPPTRAETESPVIMAMEPVVRRRRQRMRVAAGALAATVALGTAGAVMLTRGDEAPEVAASEAGKVNESPATTNAATVAAAPSNIATTTAQSANEVPAPADPGNAPSAVEVPAGPSTERAELAIATKSEVAPTRAETAAKSQSTSLKPAVTKKTVALKEPTASKPSATKTSSIAKKPAKKTAMAKVTTAKKPSAAKKPSTATKPKTKR